MLLPLAEIQFAADIPPQQRLVTYAAKWDSGSAADLATQPKCPADVDAALAERIGTAARGAFGATGCRHYARVDLRVDADQNIFILEVNGNPDIGPQAGFARARRGGNALRRVCRPPGAARGGRAVGQTGGNRGSCGPAFHCDLRARGAKRAGTVPNLRSLRSKRGPSPLPQTVLSPGS